MDIIMNETSETKQLNTMVTFPNGIIDDINLDEAPVVGQRISISNKSYRIAEAHESAHPNWQWVISLGY
jgi:hypothetical protein